MTPIPSSTSLRPVDQMQYAPNPDLQTSLPLAIVGAVLNGVLAVEKNAATLPGNTKAQLVLDSVAVGAALAPSVINLIQTIVASFNTLGIFKKKKPAPAIPIPVGPAQG